MSDTPEDEDLGFTDKKDWQRIQEEGIFGSQLAQQAMDRGLTEDEFFYLLSRYPYLELQDINAQALPANTRGEIIEGAHGWQVHDCGSYLSAGPGRLVYGPYTKEDEDDGGDSGIGTLNWQAIQTAWELIALAHARWDGVKIIGGCHSMQRAAWMAAFAYTYTLEGYEPSVFDEQAYSRLYYSGVLQGQLDVAKKSSVQKFGRR